MFSVIQFPVGHSFTNLQADISKGKTHILLFLLFAKTISKNLINLTRDTVENEKLLGFVRHWESLYLQCN